MFEYGKSVLPFTGLTSYESFEKPPSPVFNSISFSRHGNIPVIFGLTTTAFSKNSFEKSEKQMSDSTEKSVVSSKNTLTPKSPLVASVISFLVFS